MFVPFPTDVCFSEDDIPFLSQSGQLCNFSEVCLVYQTRVGSPQHLLLSSFLSLIFFLNMSHSSPEPEPDSDSPPVVRKLTRSRLPLSENESEQVEDDSDERDPTPVPKSKVKAPPKKSVKPPASTPLPRISTRPASARHPSTKQAQTGMFFPLRNPGCSFIHTR